MSPTWDNTITVFNTSHMIPPHSLFFQDNFSICTKLFCMHNWYSLLNTRCSQLFCSYPPVVVFLIESRDHGCIHQQQITQIQSSSKANPLIKVHLKFPDFIQLITWATVASDLCAPNFMVHYVPVEPVTSNLYPSRSFPIQCAFHKPQAAN